MSRRAHQHRQTGDQRVRYGRAGNDQNRLSKAKPWFAPFFPWPLLVFAVAHAQCPPAALGVPRPFVRVSVFGRAASDWWMMSASRTGAVIVCHRGCRWGTQSQQSYDHVYAIASNLVESKPGQATPSAAAGLSEMRVFVCGRQGSDYFSFYSRSQVESDPEVKHIADFTTETMRRVGGEKFVPPF